MGKCNTKAVQSDLGTLRHNQPYTGIIQPHSEPCRTLSYLEPLYIQNFEIFRTLTYSRCGACSERCQVSMMKTFAKIINSTIIIFTNYNYFHSIGLKNSLLHEINIMNFFNTGLIFTPEVVILYKKLWPVRGPGTVNFRYTY